MKINIAATHRFHVLDLARELEELGHEVRFYSYVPTKRALKYGLKRENSFSLFYVMIPFLAFVKLSGNASWSVGLLNKVLDIYLSIFMKPCDVYIALGTVYKNSLKTAKKKFDAVTILEWGSKHIEEENRILMTSDSTQNKSYFTKRSLQGYEFADYIAVASDHVMQSFLDRGIPKEKLIQNPYGVDLSMFMPTHLVQNPYDVIMVGTWSYAKGCDLLATFFEKSKLSFLHVGAIGDIRFPKFKNMTHVDPVDQTQLTYYYAKAKIFVLPSRAEGLAMVQSQALASGLPMVCSKDSGGRDLRNYLIDKKWVIEMENLSLNELSICINKALELSDKQKGLRSYGGENIKEHLTWKAYGKRYDDNLKRVMNLSKSNSFLLNFHKVSKNDLLISLLALFGEIEIFNSGLLFQFF